VYEVPDKGGAKKKVAELFPVHSIQQTNITATIAIIRQLIAIGVHYTTGMPKCQRVSNEQRQLSNQ